MVGEFQQTKFYDSNRSQQDPNRHCEQADSPLLGHIHIQKLVASIDSGLDDFNENEKKDAIAYANVDVFQESMQYIEEFGIYLFNRLSQDESYIDAIISTAPSEVKEMFEYFRDEEYVDFEDKFLGNNSIESWLSEILGYNIFREEASIRNIAEKNDTDINVDSVDEAIDKSIETVKSNLKYISRFFLQFDEVYNAIKHGRRVFPQNGQYFELEFDGESHQMQFEGPLVEFLCKSSGERGGGRPYTFLVPVQPLREEAVFHAELAHNLYSHIYQLDQSAKESRETGEEVRISGNLYGIAKSEKDNDKSRMLKIQNADGAFWIPREQAPEGLHNESGSFQFQNAVAIHEQNGDIIITTETNSKTSYEYPILSDGDMKGNPEEIIGTIVNQSFRFNNWRLPLWQYLEMVDMSNLDSVDSVILRVENNDKNDMRVDASVGLPEIPKPDERDLLEYMVRVGKAADTEIWYPEYLIDEAKEVIQKYMGKDLTRNRAKKCLSELREVTSNFLVTEESYGLLKHSDKDDIEYEVVEDDTIALSTHGVVTVHDPENEKMNLSIVEKDDERYSETSTDSPIVLSTNIIQQDSSDVAEIIRQHGLRFGSHVDFTNEIEEAATTVQIIRGRDREFTWYTMDRLEYAIYDDVPEHIVEATSED